MRALFACTNLKNVIRLIHDRVEQTLVKPTPVIWQKTTALTVRLTAGHAHIKTRCLDY